MSRNYTKWPYLPSEPPERKPRIWLPPGDILLSESLNAIGLAKFPDDWRETDIYARAPAAMGGEPPDGTGALYPIESGIEYLGLTQDTQFSRSGKNIIVKESKSWRVITSKGYRTVRSKQEALDISSVEKLVLLDMWRVEWAARKRFQAVVDDTRDALSTDTLQSTIYRTETGLTESIPTQIWKQQNAEFAFGLSYSWRLPSHRDAVSFNGWGWALLNKEQVEQFCRDKYGVQPTMAAEVSSRTGTDKTAASTFTGRAQRQFSRSAARKWYQNYVEDHEHDDPPPTRDEDWDAIRNAEEFRGGGPSRDILRELRNELAPETWTTKGRRKETGKETGIN